MMSKARCLSLFAGMLSAATAMGADLPLGETVRGRTKGSDAVSYSFTAESPGILTVFVRGDGDVVLSVVDENGRPVEDGRFDQDFGGDAGAEQGAVVLGQPGEYAVQVEPFGFSAVQFVLGASWLASELLETKPDPHGSPDDAIELELGKNLEEVLDPGSGDRVDWYRFEAESNGLLNVATRSEDGDLVLECFEDEEFDSSIERSDSDIGGSLGRESITVEVERGDVYFFVVSSFSGSAEYSVRATLSAN